MSTPPLLGRSLRARMEGQKYGKREGREGAVADLEPAPKPTPLGDELHA